MSRVTPCECCGARCLHEDPDPHADEPCYGTVKPVERKQYEGDGYIGEVFVHVCDGHTPKGAYKPQDDSG